MGESTGRERGTKGVRVANAPERLGRAPPEFACRGQGGHRAGMILHSAGQEHRTRREGFRDLGKSDRIMIHWASCPRCDVPEIAIAKKIDTPCRNAGPRSEWTAARSRCATTPTRSGAAFTRCFRL